MVGWPLFIKVCDVDPKMLTNIPKYFQLHAEIAAANAGDF